MGRIRVSGKQIRFTSFPEAGSLYKTTIQYYFHAYEMPRTVALHTAYFIQYFTVV